MAKDLNEIRRVQDEVGATKTKLAETLNSIQQILNSRQQTEEPTPVEIVVDTKPVEKVVVEEKPVEKVATPIAVDEKVEKKVEKEAEQKPVEPEVKEKPVVESKPVEKVETVEKPVNTNPTQRAPQQQNYNPQRQQNNNNGNSRIYINRDYDRNGRPTNQGQGGQRPPYNGQQNGQRPPYNGPRNNNGPQGQRPPYNGPRPNGQGQGPRGPYNGPRPPYNGPRPGFGRPKIDDSIASPIVAKEDHSKVKKTVQKTDNSDKKTLNKRDLLKRGYEYDSSLESDDGVVRFKGKKEKKQHQQIQYQEITEAVLNSEIVPIKVFSEKIGKPATEIVKKLFDLAKMVTINSTISFEDAELIALDYGITLTLKPDKTAEDKLSDIIQQTTDDNKGELVKRPPIVTIMGHVDHGKTSLLDYIRKTNVIATEAGGITQHIGAYTIDVKGEKITFLDTPGHEAFTAMRKRGAKVTDIAVIVVAADDCIMPQTIEAISHAKEAGVSIIIAANKIDKTNGDYSQLLQQLPKYDLMPEEWGGDTIVCPISAKFGKGVDALLDSILLVSEMLELKATKKCAASGSIIEARLDKSIGPVATVLVQNGTLKVKDYVVAGTTIGKVRAMTDCTNKAVKEAGPSYAVQIQGFQEVPNAGDNFVVVKDEKLAKQVAEERADKERSSMSMQNEARTLEDMFKDQNPADMKILPVIIKADVQGSCEAVKQALLKLSAERAKDNVKIKIIHAGVGAINESDVMLADTTNAIILGFNVRPESKARVEAEREKIDIRNYSIIYDAIDDLDKALKGMLAPTFKETALGRVEIRDLFKITGVGMIAGCYVLEGKVQRNCGYRLIRDNIVIHTGKIVSLKRMKDDAKEVAAGYECGIGLDSYNDFKVGDILETFIMEKEEIE